DTLHPCSGRGFCLVHRCRHCAERLLGQLNSASRCLPFPEGLGSLAQRSTIGDWRLIRGRKCAAEATECRAVCPEGPLFQKPRPAITGHAVIHGQQGAEEKRVVGSPQIRKESPASHPPARCEVPRAGGPRGGSLAPAEPRSEAALRPIEGPAAAAAA